MKLRPRARLVWDIETDGLLDELTVVHVLSIRDLDTRQTFVFRRNAKMDNIRDGIAMLNDAELLVGHNIVGFDNYALWKVYGDEFAPTGEMRDTLVMAQMMFSDIKDKDFRLWKRGDLPGELIGRHTLGAWGARLGFPKDDYSKRRKEEALNLWANDPSLAERFADVKDFIKHHTWAEWNQEMEDYGIKDLDPTEALWMKICGIDWASDATKLEHMISDLTARIEQNGIDFDLEGARALEAELRHEHDTKAEAAIAHFGRWMTAGKWSKAGDPRIELGEDKSRQNWAEVTVPKRSMKFKDPMAKGGDKIEDAPYCPIVVKDFNPNSRPMIIDRLTKIYEWEPQEFTEKNNPIVNDEVLRDLGLRIPICIELAEIFYFKKRLGQLADGTQSWIGAVKADGRIHPRTNPGGTVTNRASHSGPNIAQVPRVVFKKLAQWVEPGVVVTLGSDGKLVYALPDQPDAKLTPLRGPDGKQIMGIPVAAKPDVATEDEAGALLAGFVRLEGREGVYLLDDDGAVKVKSSLMRGRVGDHGWNCRNLFIVPKGWVLMGADQKGIELRALAHAMWEFDDGAYAKILLEGDIHDAHTAAMELDSRDKAKTFIYALLYGAQDFKLGTTLDPTLAMYPAKAKALGAQMRERLMSRFPALKMLTKAVQRSARQGYVLGLDGRRLFVRAKHAALNTLLQGMGASLAKVWCVAFEAMMEEEGFVHGWDGDFVILAWVHDELQVAVRDDRAVQMAAQRIITEAATYSGERLDFKLPVEIDVKFGMTWAQTH